MPKGCSGWPSPAVAASSAVKPTTAGIFSARPRSDGSAALATRAGSFTSYRSWSRDCAVSEAATRSVLMMMVVFMIASSVLRDVVVVVPVRVTRPRDIVGVERSALRASACRGPRQRIVDDDVLLAANHAVSPHHHHV